MLACRALLALSLMAIACGRIGYDSVALVDDAGGGDAAPGQPDADPTAPDADPAAPDADPAAPDAALACPSICNLGCGDGVCNILGDTLDATGTPIVCPPGLPCHVTCGQRQTCRTRIDCTQATGSCLVDCSGDRSCFFGATCGAAPCEIRCVGFNSCGPLECGETPSCTIACIGDNSCAFGAICCGAASSCDIACTGGGSCSGTMRCDGDPDCDLACP